MRVPSPECKSKRCRPLRAAVAHGIGGLCPFAAAGRLRGVAAFRVMSLQDGDRRAKLGGTTVRPASTMPVALPRQQPLAKLNAK